MCVRLIPGSVRGSLLVRLGIPYGVLGIESGSAASKARPAVPHGSSS